MKYCDYKVFVVVLSALLWGINSNADVRITGRVSDAAGEGVAAAMLKGKTGKKVEAYALTDEEGRYELKVSDALMKSGTVEISSMGFTVLTLPLQELAKTPDVVMTRDISQLDEVVVKGKGHKVKHPDWLAYATIYEADLRHASEERSLAGLTKRLPDLLELGVNVIKLMPIHPVSEKNRRGALGSPYAVADYRKINPDFGSFEDLKKFVAIAHLIGIRVILDESCAFSGMDHSWVERHPEYYARTDSGEFVIPPRASDAYKFDYSHPEWRRAMIEALTFWVQVADIDGYHFSFAEDVPADFWVRARKTVQQVKPVAFIAEASDPQLVKEAFDSDYSWALTDTLTALAATQGVNRFAIEHNLPFSASDAQAIPGVLKAHGKHFPKGSLHLNLTESQNLNAQEGTAFERYGDAARVFAMLTYTLPGIPMIATGQEVGLDRPLSRFSLDSVPDFKSTPFGDLYKKLGALRRDHPALWQDIGKNASFSLIETTSPDILAFERQKDDDRVMVFANLSSEPQDLNFPGAEPYMKGMENKIYPFVRHIPAQLQPWEFHVFAPEVEEDPETYMIELGSNVDRAVILAAIFAIKDMFRYRDAKSTQEKKLTAMLDKIRAGEMRLIT